ncbi:Rha family transcriptional regulator [Wukongibacter sp. M2B1]|uniref:Rha family transcriptional regulator n=1 Tax=Wukongibacter sp. M2B1 TaxID=3088895 RepID=UPI003D7A2B47
MKLKTKEEITITNLVMIKGNDVFTDSLVIAKGTEYNHPVVQRKLRDFNKDFLELGKLGFENRPLASGQKQKIYLLNEMQATYLTTLLENNVIVRRFKLNLVKQFFAMRQALVERQSTEWLQTRKQGKLTRRNETDMLQELSEYAVNQGSGTYKSKPNMIYIHYSKLVNSAVGIKKGEREFVNRKVLDTIAFLEDMILHTVKEEMIKGTHYKEIYQICKRKVNQVIEFAYLPKQRLLIS